MIYIVQLSSSAQVSDIIGINDDQLYQIIAEWIVTLWQVTAAQYRLPFLLKAVSVNRQVNLSMLDLW